MTSWNANFSTQVINELITRGKVDVIWMKRFWWKQASQRVVSNWKPHIIQVSYKVGWDWEVIGRAKDLKKKLKEKGCKEELGACG